MTGAVLLAGLGTTCFAEPLESRLAVDARMPGCPPSPDAIAEALLALVDGV